MGDFIPIRELFIVFPFAPSSNGEESTIGLLAVNFITLHCLYLLCIAIW